MGRSLGVIAFIAVVGAIAVYCARRPTIARGDVLAAELMGANPLLTKLDCDREVPITRTGAEFSCEVAFKDGDKARYTFRLSRDGHIAVAGTGPARPIKKTSDPWGD